MWRWSCPWLLLHGATKNIFLLNGSNRITNALDITESCIREVLKQVAQKFQLLLFQLCRGNYHLPAVRRSANFLSIVTLSVTWKSCLLGSNSSCLVSKRVKRIELFKLLSSWCCFFHLQAILRDRGQYFLGIQPVWWGFLSVTYVKELEGDWFIMFGFHSWFWFCFVFLKYHSATS